MARSYRAPLPKTFFELTGGQGVLFGCARCSRATAVDRADALDRWGRETSIASVAKRFRCSNCAGRGATAEMVRVSSGGPTEGERARAKLSPLDRLVADMMKLKPEGIVR